MIKKALNATLISSMSVSFLWHFSNIIRKGSYYIQEPNMVVLISEVVLMSLIFLYGLYLLIGIGRGRED